MTDLKKLLMELGNELVISYGADPHTDSRCVAIQKLPDELNAWGGVGVEDSGEAMRGQLELVDTSAKLGFLWPTVRRPAEPLKLGSGMKTSDLDNQPERINDGTVCEKCGGYGGEHQSDSPFQNYLPCYACGF